MKSKDIDKPDQIAGAATPPVPPVAGLEPALPLKTGEFRLSDVPPGAALLVGGMAVFNVAGELCATQAKCTHMGGPLGKGVLDGSTVTCPWHGSQFNVCTGAVMRGPAREPLKTYRVSLEGDVGRVGPTITDHEAAQVERANASSATPVVFVHGLWLLPSSWDRWVTLFEDAGYVGLTPGWPDDPETVAEAREHPEVFAGKGIREIADYQEAIIRRLDRKPVIIGHSFGGLLTMILAGRGLAAASVAISPAPFRGVLPLPIAALRSASVALRNPANWNRAVPLSYEQFRYSFANAVGEDEAKELYLGYSVPGAGEPLFQAASANLNPWTEAKVDSTNPERGPMLIVSADSDQTVPWAIANAAYKKQKRNKGVTEIVKMPGRGHALTIDAGWREVAEKALEFVKRLTGAPSR